MKLVQFPWAKGETEPFYSTGIIKFVAFINTDPVFAVQITHTDTANPATDKVSSHEYSTLSDAMMALGQFIGDCTGDYSIRNRWDPTLSPIDLGLAAPAAEPVVEPPAPAPPPANKKLRS